MAPGVKVFRLPSGFIYKPSGFLYKYSSFFLYIPDDVPGKKENIPKSILQHL